VREQLVQWLHETDAASLPRTRIQSVDPAERPRPVPLATGPIGLFTGTPEAEERASQFTGVLPVVNPDRP
jgi:hypothetical protein